MRGKKYSSFRLFFLVALGGGLVQFMTPAATPQPGIRKLQYIMTIQMDTGKIVIQLFPDAAPHTVAHVVDLIRKKFYDGLTFHRVEANFLVQGGDPKGDGTGGSGLKLKAEFNSKRHATGTVSMARGTDPYNADSQFFICLTPQWAFDGKYTVIGQVISGMDVVRKIKKGDVMRRVTAR